MFGLGRIELKSLDEIALMRAAGLVVADALDAARAAAVVGSTTASVDAVAAAVIREAGAQSSFLGYQGFPATTCISVNDEVVHGIPGERVLRDGDLVSIDCGAIVDGWHGDSALSFVVGGADPADLALVDVTRDAMWAGVAALAGATRLSEIGAAVEAHVEEHAPADGGYGIVQEYVGHGIGSAMHQSPDVPNFRTRDRGPKIRPGMCLAIEPMVTRGERFTQVCEDDWTVVTDDGTRAAHWEHTVAVLEDGIFVLTARDGGRSALEPLGVTLSSLL